MAVGAIHLVPEFLDGECVLADEQAAQRSENSGQRLGIDVAVDAFLAALGADAQVMMTRGVGFLARRAFLEHRRPAIRIQVQRLDLVLAGDTARRLARPGDAQDLDFGDDQVRQVQRRRERLAHRERQTGEGRARTQVLEKIPSSHVCVRSL